MLKKIEWAYGFGRPISIDSAGKIYTSKNLHQTIYINNDSIVPDEDFQEIAILIFDQDGSLSVARKIRFKSEYNCDCNYYGGKIFFGKNEELFLLYDKFDYSYDEMVYTVQFNSDLDSINSFPGYLVDETVQNAYYLTNPIGHYGWEPILHKFNLTEKLILWSKALGESYECFLLSPYLKAPLLLPGNVILTYGHGDDSPCTIDDTIFYFAGIEMLFALMDTSGHYYFIKNEKVPGTWFVNASYDENGYAYLISSWNKDTSYTMGTSFNTAAGNLVISKLKYLDVSTGIPLKDSNSHITIDLLRKSF